MAKDNQVKSARADLEGFLSTIGLAVAPTIHVNGKDFPNAILTVDFGFADSFTRLTNEQGKELASKMRKFSKEITNRDGNYRISSDSYMGTIYWCALH